MADPGQLGDIVKVASGGVGGAALTVMLGKVLGGVLQGWLSGTTGQEKELRGDLIEEIKTLRTELRTTREEVSELRQDVQRLTEKYLYVLTTRAEARAALNVLERAQGLPATAWPADPVDPPGGTS